MTAQICQCGSMSGYQHAGDCPRPLFTDGPAAVATWTAERDELGKVARCHCYAGHHSASGRCRARGFYAKKSAQPSGFCAECLRDCVRGVLKK